ncbi:HNH endonuclease family protein [Rhodococcoides fascians]|uniref:HNH endonuclease family protein n=1 Tax=Rhodococcoides fascians TaxID=1828 RepID=UPI001E35026D|nr:HNH endonuclease family protein [Rhodococcus fascians]
MKIHRNSTSLSVLALVGLAVGGVLLGGMPEAAVRDAPSAIASADDAADLAAARQQAPSQPNPQREIDGLLASVTVVDELPDIQGYDRKCGPTDGCTYGTAWTDDSTAPGSHNGCDTRNDVLGAQLYDIEYKPGTSDCKVLTGTLADPYTGGLIHFVSGKTTSSAVQIDHVYPLSRSWRAGAASWSIERRTAFANDIDLNLLAVDGPANNAKSDSGLDAWLPPNQAYHCQYAVRYLTVAAHYQLLVTRGDADVARAACGSRQ